MEWPHVTVVRGPHGFAAGDHHRLAIASSRAGNVHTGDPPPHQDGRVKHGQAITRIVARPMFPSYGFVRKSEASNTEAILAVRGVRGFMRNERGELVTLPHQAVLAIYDKQQEEHRDFLETSRRRRRFVATVKIGQRMRVDDGGIYSGLVAAVDRIDARGRVELLFGMIRHSLPADMVVAA